MEYYKDIGSKKAGRTLGRKGPRDLQRQGQQVIVDNTDVVNELKAQINNLTQTITQQQPVAPAPIQEPTGSGAAKYTAEEFDEELIKQVTAAVKGKEKEIEALKEQLKAKDAIIASKDETIQSLKLRGVSVEDVVTIEDPDRPQMETVFIDPNDKGEGSKMQSFIEIEAKEDSNIGDQINKLKGLIGGIPKKN